MLSRMRFVEEVGLSFAVAVAGVTDTVHADAGNPTDSLGIVEPAPPEPAPAAEA